MSGGYTKVFGSMLTSSIWEESHETFRVWITLLLLADKDGVVDASVPGLARMARVTLEQCEAALLVLASPDKYSRTPDLEGRRLESVNPPWRLVNHAKYRLRLGVEERAAYKAAHQQRRRDQQRAASTQTRAAVSKLRGVGK